MSKGNAPALDYSLRLFNDLKSRGIQVILISARREHLRSATIDNLVKVGYHGWTSLVLRLVAPTLPLLLSHYYVLFAPHYLAKSFLCFALFYFSLCRDPADELVSVEKYKSDVRKQLISNGYHIWGILGDQYSSIEGPPSGIRAFKLPNPMYYVA